MRIKITATITAKTSTKLRKRALKNLREMLIKPEGKRHKKNFDAIIEFLELPQISKPAILLQRKPGPHNCQLIPLSKKTDPLIKLSKSHKNHTLNHKPTL
jgi:hypothetical protein